MESLRRTDSPKDFGCAYRKLTSFNWAGDWFGISVFVNRRIAPDRPIAITIQRHHNRQEVGREQVGLINPHNETRAITTVASALDHLGCDAALSAFRAERVWELISQDADTITAAIDAAGWL